MNPQPTMNQLIDIFFTSIATPSTTLRERYFLRESLYILQRLSLSQHKLEMAPSLKKIIPNEQKSNLNDFRRMGQIARP